MSKIGLEFLPNPGGEAEGLSDAGIETFRDKPFAAVARETGQNSRDARSDVTKPVRLAFDVLTISSDKFPSVSDYRSAAGRCLAKAQKTKNEKDLGFFAQAVKALNEPEIRVLRISDFNTKGVRGPCEEGRPFHTLAKTDGVSTKDDINAGGSFGIGKNAVFALSDMQTAFFSTRYLDDAGNDQVLCMGKTQFISHTGEDGSERRRKGYWGKKDGYLPLDDPKDIPNWLLRDSQGTSIFSICMRGNRTDWRYEMAAAILINFFGAIQRQEMEFEIDDGNLKINRTTIQAFFADPAVNKAVDELNARTVFDAARTLHGCLIDEKTQTFTLDVRELGQVNLRILLRDGLGYTLGIVRNGMYITDNLANFNEPFKRFPMHREFAAIIEPAGAAEGEWFKRVENPRHDDLSAERITDPELRAQGQRAFERLAKSIRAKIKELAKSEPTSSMELDELNDFFASDESRTEDDLGTVTDPRAFKPTPVKPSEPRKRRSVYQPGGEEADGPGPKPEPDPDPNAEPNPEPNPNPGPVTRRRRTADPVLLQNERNTIPDAGKPSKRRIIFTPPVSGDINLSIEASGLSTPERLVITSADTGAVKDGAVVISCERDMRVTIDVEFSAPYTGPIELAAFTMEDPETGVAA